MKAAVRLATFFLLVQIAPGCLAQNTSTPSSRTLDQNALNLGFERSNLDGSPSGWFVAMQKDCLDSTIKHSGKFSLRLISTRSAAATMKIPAQKLRGKTLTVSGWVKRLDIKGFVGFWIRLDGKGRNLAFNDMHASNLKGTRDWTFYSCSVEVDTSAEFIAFGALITGVGTGWFDDIGLQSDGNPVMTEEYEHSAWFQQYDVPKTIITGAEVQWVRAHATPISTVDPQADLSDLERVSTIVGDATIVGLGEATHGTKEFFEMKHRLIEFLVTRLGFDVVAMESGMPTSVQLNEYIINGTGNPKELLKNLILAYDTQEVLDLVEWMRKYNTAHSHKICLMNFDTKITSSTLQDIEQFLGKVDPQYVGTVIHTFSEISALSQSLNMQSPASRADFFTRTRLLLDSTLVIESHMESNRDHYAEKSDRDSVEWVLQCVRNVCQNLKSVLPGNPNTRDSSMAENVSWIKTHLDNPKIILWAHNGHIGKKGDAIGLNSMGAYLFNKYGPKYRCLGFAFDSGTYAAATFNNKLDPHVEASAAPIGSLEYALHNVGLPMFCLNLREASPSDSNAVWLSRPIGTRNIGAVVSDAYEQVILTQTYDGLLYFDQSTPSHMLRDVNTLR